MERLLWRSGKGRRGRDVARSAAVAGCCAALVMAPQTAAMAATAAGSGNPYAFAAGASVVGGAAGGAAAARLKTGGTYRSSLAAGNGSTAHYRVELDGAATAYASVVAVPPLGPGARTAAADGITVSLRDSQGRRCDEKRATFRSGPHPRPIAVAVERSVRPGGLRCQSAGTYDVVVERAEANGAGARAWGLELRVSTEPGLVSPVTGERAGARSSAPVRLPSGAGERRSGGTGFNDARALTSGVWKGRFRPGQSHFYRVPVDWGQRLALGAELDGSTKGAGRSGTVAGALDMELYNPARASVAAEAATYAGGPTSAGLDPLPPVAYGNRLLSGERGGGAAMRLAGWYVLEVTLSPAMAEKSGSGDFGVTLRVAVDGDARQAPDYVRDPGEFQVTADDVAAAERGAGGAAWGGGSAERGEESAAGGDSRAGSGAGRGGASGGAAASSAAPPGDGPMVWVGVAGIGVGSALVLWLGAWRVVAVRRLRRVRG